MTLEADIERHRADGEAMLKAGHKVGELVGACLVVIRCVCGREREQRIPIMKAAPFKVEGFPEAKVFAPLLWYGVKDCGCGRAWSFYVTAEPPPVLDLGAIADSATEGKT